MALVREYGLEVIVRPAHLATKAALSALAYVHDRATDRNHGVTTDHRQRAEPEQFGYDMADLGYKYTYRLMDLQCARPQAAQTAAGVRRSATGHCAKIRQFVERQPVVASASNVSPGTFPRGLDAEVVRLDGAWRLASDPIGREHATPYARRHADRFPQQSV